MIFFSYLVEINVQDILAQVQNERDLVQDTNFKKSNRRHLTSIFCLTFPSAELVMIFSLFYKITSLYMLFKGMNITVFLTLIDFFYACLSTAGHKRTRCRRQLFCSYSSGTDHLPSSQVSGVTLLDVDSLEDKFNVNIW